MDWTAKFYYLCEEDWLTVPMFRPGDVAVRPFDTDETTARHQFWGKRLRHKAATRAPDPLLDVDEAGPAPAPEGGLDLIVESEDEFGGVDGGEPVAPPDELEVC